MNERAIIGTLSVALLALTTFGLALARNVQIESRQNRDTALELRHTLERRHALIEDYALKQGQHYAEQAALWDRLLASEADHARCEADLTLAREAASALPSVPRRVPGPLPKKAPDAEVWVQ